MLFTSGISASDILSTDPIVFIVQESVAADCIRPGLLKTYLGMADAIRRHGSNSLLAQTFVQAALFPEDFTAASMKAMPSTPSCTLG